MKSVLKVFGIIAMIAVIGFAMVSCDNPGGGDGGNGDGGGGNGIPSTNGRLTITGLEDYNGKYVLAQGGIGAVQLLGCVGGNASQESVFGGRISNGSVTLNVWNSTDLPDVKNYSGNDQAMFYIGIYNTESVRFRDMNVDNIALGRLSGVNFSNGVGSGMVEWEL